MTTHAFTRRTLLAAAGLSLAAPAVLRAQTYPSRPIELYVGFAPGGGTDITARTFAKFLETELGGSVLVVNKPGASGEIALAQVARAEPDGHTLGITNMPGFVTIPIERKAQYRLDDFHLVANLVADSSAFSVAPDSPIRTVEDLVKAAKARPGQITFGSTGVGTDDHLALVLFEDATGTKLNHIAFRGAGPLATALVGKHVDVAGLNVGEAVPQGANLRIVAQAGATRSRFAPGVPTFRELEIGIEMGSERGLVAPRGLDPRIAERLARAVAKVFETPDFLARIEQQYTEAAYRPGPAWRDGIAAADARFRTLWQSHPWSSS
ncbi:tripartite tricarboxylate transporter substrate binding protein [Rhodoplanes sp. TEM]|uniref:Tripartite tricarboxylate transporter substrate binding protein n=1 Tax=Rhodoplanes tepidamans TaxID=200616 RepID=A0ABT5JBA3_RHOTP|nr:MULTISPECIES: tripartite tricarboxylate transporter substrate binding protein [Rhodoplanes]MDC7786960.1 tripartite tricarboxylate transporter substrate binding protein [Rhodoplanes tepidamans]MDC7985049.1 tripartite tricarboxylate transporter substrate binding protein [Rhodoplanes sp. TEM]MDQ0355343.1 tripartite-type tricarboxylate transporter receptor subunit TctC [Rhodoplanes tepidamans]